jgi:Transmembrane secretion effector
MDAFGDVTARTDGGSFRTSKIPDRYIEAFLVNSWAEHARQHERATRADREVEERAHSYIRGTPTVRHLLYMTTKP